MVEGDWYCPSMPTALVDATKDLRAKRIDLGHYDLLIARRAKFLLRDKARPDADGHVAKRCPASGPSPTVTCPLKPRSSVVGLGMPRVLATPTEPPRVCTNKQSITIPPEIGAKYKQDIRYGTPEWRDAFAGPRNRGEQELHGVADDATPSGIGEVAVCGVFDEAVETLDGVTVACANVRKIRAWLRRGANGPAPTTGTRDRTTDRRRRANRLGDYLPDPNAPPGIGPPADLPAAS